MLLHAIKISNIPLCDDGWTPTLPRKMPKFALKKEKLSAAANNGRTEAFEW
jgi:hypothetical protein